MTSLLVLGGTSWLGGRVVRDALESGLEVTCLARGETGMVPEGATWVRADRNDASAYDEVAGRSWDLVLDVSRQPRQVRSAVAALGGRAGHWVFVSTISVYAEGLPAYGDENAELLPPLEGDVDAGIEEYGEGKVACEQAVREGLGEHRALIARAGLIVGRGDRSDRFGYWPARAMLAADGEPVLCPPREQPLQVIDVEDLASWLLVGGLAHVAGTFNAVGHLVSVGDALDTCAEVAGTAPEWREASERWLLEHEVAPWMGPGSLPLWLPAEDQASMTVDGSSARREGLVNRPLAETARAALEWECELGLERSRWTGLTRERERELLAELDR
jgi:nucleoside-diphosphate-sugar epimerase